MVAYLYKVTNVAGKTLSERVGNSDFEAFRSYCRPDECHLQKAGRNLVDILNLCEGACFAPSIFFL